MVAAVGSLFRRDAHPCIVSVIPSSVIVRALFGCSLDINLLRVHVSPPLSTCLHVDNEFEIHHYDTPLFVDGRHLLYVTQIAFTGVRQDHIFIRVIGDLVNVADC